MLRLGWAETKILFCVLLPTSFFSSAQQEVVAAPIPISLVVWLFGTRCARSLVSEHPALFYSFSLGVVWPYMSVSWASHVPSMRRRGQNVTIRARTKPRPLASVNHPSKLARPES